MNSPLSMTLLDDQPSDPEPLVIHSYSEANPIEVAIVSAFAKVGMNVSETENVISDFVDPDALADYLESSTPVSVTARLWGHPVLIEPGIIYIFDKENDV